MAYYLKEEHRNFNNIEEKDFMIDNHAKQLDYLIDTMITSNIKEMIDSGKSLKHWRIEIMNSFTWYEG